EQETVYEQEPIIEQETADEPQTEIYPGIMPDIERCYCQSCTTADNNDGYIWLPEGLQYEWRAGTEGEFFDTVGNGISLLSPGIYQVRLKETAEHLASEPLTFEVKSYVAPVEEKAAEPVVEIVPKPVDEPPAAPVSENIQQTGSDEPSPSPEIMQVAVPAEPEVPVTEDVISVTVSAEPKEKVKIDAMIKLDTGVDALKAADTVMLLTSGAPELPKAAAPSDISFTADGFDTGFLSGSGLAVGQKYKVGESGVYVLIESLDSASHFPLSDLPGACTVYVVNPGVENTSVDSDPLEIEIAQFPKPTSEEVIATNATAEKTDEGSLYFDRAGSYAYREKESGSPFNILTGCDPSQPIRFACKVGTYEIRKQYSGNTLASESVFLTIKGYNAPNVTFEADSDCSGYLGTVTKDMAYRTNKGDWCGIADGTSRVYFSSVTKGVSIEVCYPDTGATTEIILDRQETPNDTIVKVTDCTNSSNNNGTITLDTANYTDYEIRFGTSGSFTPVTAPKITGLTNGTYQLRTRASGNKLASNLCNVTVKEYVPPRGIDCQSISIQPYEKIFDTTDGYSTLTVSFYPYNTTNQTVTFSSSNEGVVNFGSQSRTVVGADGRATIKIYPVGSGEAKITATTANGKTAVCNTTVSFEYRFTYNKSGTWYYDRGGDYTVQTNGPMSRFSALKINGNTVNPQYYTVRANTDGTTILTISQYAMSSLNHGAYQKLQLVYNDGGVATTFLHILSVNDRPITGDDGNAVFWAITGLSALAALAAVTMMKRNNSRRKKSSC
ncbi:MAG: hypothetical protein Q4F31_05105, partial [Eubacteriales bacterium]|nr:hypothetical protein [Eubacteriales bacterium]